MSIVSSLQHYIKIHIIHTYIRLKDTPNYQDSARPISKTYLHNIMTLQCPVLLYRNVMKSSIGLKGLTAGSHRIDIDTRDPNNLHMLGAEGGLCI